MGVADDEVGIPELVGFFKYNYIDLSDVKRGYIQELCGEIKNNDDDVDISMQDLSTA